MSRNGLGLPLLDCLPSVTTIATYYSRKHSPSQSSRVTNMVQSYPTFQHEGSHNPVPGEQMFTFFGGGGNLPDCSQPHDAADMVASVLESWIGLYCKTAILHTHTWECVPVTTIGLRRNTHRIAAYKADHNPMHVCSEVPFCPQDSAKVANMDFSDLSFASSMSKCVLGKLLPQVPNWG